MEILPSLLALERDLGECRVVLTIKGNVLRVKASKGQMEKHVDIDVTKSLYQKTGRYANFGDTLEILANELNL